MSELQADTLTAKYVRREAETAGLTESEWLARHFRSAILRDHAERMSEWYRDRPGLFEAEIEHAQAVSEAIDAAS